MYWLVISMFILYFVVLMYESYNKYISLTAVKLPQHFSVWNTSADFVYNCTVYCFDAVTGCREEGRGSLIMTVV